ncbi:hypothetical protein CA951_31215 [Rhodococcus sp. NCIMB 12038]|nr:hypothetical protein CA951_31215 [Rhodococcus sp. NCIMB 12038]
MAAQRDSRADEDAREAATEWYRWGCEYVGRIDPLGSRLAMPTIRRPTWEEQAALIRALMRELDGWRELLGAGGDGGQSRSVDSKQELVRDEVVSVPYRTMICCEHL